MDHSDCDEISYDVRNNVAYLEILRVKENNSSAGSRVYSTDGPNFQSVIVNLIDYHEGCLMANMRGKLKVYSGCGSERGEWEDRELRSWKLKDASILPHSEKVLLEKIISMHNQVTSRCSPVTAKV